MARSTNKIKIDSIDQAILTILNCAKPTIFMLKFPYTFNAFDFHQAFQEKSNDKK